jgi:hypothetical protein
MIYDVFVSAAGEKGRVATCYETEGIAAASWLRISPEKLGPTSFADFTSESNIACTQHSGVAIISIRTSPN